MSTTPPIVGAILGCPGGTDLNTHAGTPWPASWTPADLDLRALVALDRWAGPPNTQYLCGSFDPNTPAAAHSFGMQITVAGKGP